MSQLPTDIGLFSGFGDSIVGADDGLGGILTGGLPELPDGVGGLLGGDAGGFLSTIPGLPGGGGGGPGAFLPPIDFASNPVSTSGTGSGGTGLKLFQPVTTLSFGGDSGGAKEITQSVLNNLSNQARALTGADSFLGKLGIGSDTLLVIGVTLVIGIATIALRR